MTNLEEHPDGDVKIDIEAEAVTHSNTTVTVAFDNSMKEALVEEIWDTTAVMYSNMSKVESAVDRLPYVESDD